MASNRMTMPHYNNVAMEYVEIYNVERKSALQ